MTTRRSNSAAFDIIFEGVHNLFQVPENFPYRAARLAMSDTLERPWYVEYYVWDMAADKLRRKRMVLAQPTAKARRQEAAEIIPEINHRLANGWVMNPKKAAPEEIMPMSQLAAAIEFFLLYCQRTTKGRTYRGYISDFKHLYEFLRKHHLERIKLKDFSESSANRWLDWLIIERKVSNRRRNNLKATASTMFNFYRKRKVVTSNPFLEVGKLPTVSRKHVPFSEEDVRVFKAYCEEHDPQLWLFINFIYYCFIRPGVELRLLKVGDILEKSIVISGENSKNKKTQHVQIPPPLERLIQRYRLRTYPAGYYVFGLGGPAADCVGRNYFYNKNLAVLNAVELSGLAHDLYCWKHTGVIALFKKTQNIELIRAQCRHADIGTTQEYLRDLGLFFDYNEVESFPEI